MIDLSGECLDEVGAELHYFVEADLPIPEPVTVEGTVTLGEPEVEENQP